MAQPREKLDEIFFDILGSTNVYFQPPPTVQMQYPAIRYSLDNIDTKRANNGVYKTLKKYNVVYITDDPDDPIVEKLLHIPYCSMDTSFPVDGLYNNNYTLYF